MHDNPPKGHSVKGVQKGVNYAINLLCNKLRPRKSMGVQVLCPYICPQNLKRIDSEMWTPESGQEISTAAGGYFLQMFFLTNILC